MNVHRNAVLASAIGLALAAGLIAPDASAREQEHKQHADHGKGGDKAKGNDKTHQKAHGDQGQQASKHEAHDHQARREHDGGDHARRQASHEERRSQPSERVRVERHDNDTHRKDRRNEYAADPTVRPSTRALEVRQREEAHARNARREAERREVARHDDDRRRTTSIERQRLVMLQHQREAEYRRYLAARNAAESQRIDALRAQRRAQQYAYQQWYWQQQRAMQARWQPRDYANDPYYYAPMSYRYVRDGRAREVNRYAADLLQDAVRNGYQMGARAGYADRADGWRSDYRNNDAYQDASYGYNGYYVDQDEYNYYFRQGFQRGYQDAYGNDYRYGTRNDGNSDGLGVILASVLQSILGLQQY